jgi:hypothetical protein
LDAPVRSLAVAVILPKISAGEINARYSTDLRISDLAAVEQTLVASVGLETWNSSLDPGTFLTGSGGLVESCPNGCNNDSNANV